MLNFGENMLSKVLLISLLSMFISLFFSCSKKDQPEESEKNSKEPKVGEVQIQNIEEDPLSITEETVENNSEPLNSSEEEEEVEKSQSYDASIKSMYYNGRYNEIINSTTSNNKDLFYKGMSFYMLAKKTPANKTKSLINRAIAIFDKIAINARQNSDLKAKAALWKGILTLIYQPQRKYKVKMKPFLYLVNKYDKSPFYDDGLFYSARASQLEDRYDLAAKYFSKMEKLRKGKIYDVWQSKFISVRKALAKYGKGSSSGFAFGSKMNSRREKKIVDKLYEMTLEKQSNEKKISGVEVYERKLKKKRAPVTSESTFKEFDLDEDNDNKELNKAIDEGL